MFRFTILIAALLAGLTRASDPAPVALTQGQWLGNDGNWSTAEFMIGSPEQTVNVLVSNSISEFLAVGPGGCLANEPHCATARGDIFDPKKSKHWSSLGPWQLDLSYLGYDGNGDYGLDSIDSHSPITDKSFRMDHVLMAAVNASDYFLGMFGLGITQSSFGNRVAESPVTQAVKTFGRIPSYSHGYTAGAHYRNIPMSTTLGGYDASRLKSHDISFTLPQADGIPSAFVRGLQVTTDEGQTTPDDWDSDTQILTEWNNSFTAKIDSSTPYLWLPDSVCDRFAEALGLHYNDTFDLYTVTDDQYQTYSQEKAFSFTFTFSSIDNSDDFGSPLDVPGVVNITIPSRAFISLLGYPFMDDAIEYGDPAVPYFSLRRAQNSSFIIGRSFLQESYLITKYDEGVFSLHEALFSETPDLITIKRPDNSPYPGPPAVDHKFTTAQMAGIAVAVVIFVVLVLMAGWYVWRRKKRSSSDSVAVLEANKDSTSSLSPDTPRTPISRILSKIARRKRSRKPIEEEKQQPSEAPDSEIYELPAPVPPAELDGGGDDHSDNGETELGLENTQTSSAYEQARRKLDRQLRGPVPEYTPPASGALPPPEKTFHDMGPADSRRTFEQPSPVSSPTRSPHGADGDSNSLPMSLPSPLSPTGDDASRWEEGSSSNTGSAPRLPYPIITTTSSGPKLALPMSATSGATPMSRSNSDNSVSPISPQSVSLPSSSGALQRTPIDPSKVVCLGPLPENVQLPIHNSPPRLPADLRNLHLPDTKSSSHRSTDSLGSNFTDDEERMVQEMTRQQRSQSVNGTDRNGRRRPQPSLQTQGHAIRRHQSDRTADPDTPHSQERIDSGTELIHVPQMAAKRYSWEESSL